jgi:hypothetical protein
VFTGERVLLLEIAELNSRQTASGRRIRRPPNGALAQGRSADRPRLRDYC